MTSHSDAIMQILSKNQAATVLFLEKVIRDVDIGVHNHEIGSHSVSLSTYTSCFVEIVPLKKMKFLKY